MATDIRRTRVDNQGLRTTGDEDRPAAVRGRSGSQQSLTIELLGGFRVSVGGRSVDESEWYLRKAKSLIKLLALEENHRLHRGEMTDFLWPELDMNAAGNNLHKALHIARRVLEPELPAKTASRFLQLNGDLVVLACDDLWIDVEQFRAAASRAQASGDVAEYEAALALYRGEILPEDRYEEWTVRPRAELRQLYLTLLLELAELQTQHGASNEAIYVLRQAIGIDTANEQAHVALMHLLAGSGQRQAALRQYGQLRDALKQELDADPDMATQRLYSEILSGRYSPALVAATPQSSELATATSSHGLVGRDEELQALRESLDDLFEGHGSLVFLSGPSGVGKSSLVDVMQHEATRRGAVALWGAAYKEEKPLAYGPIAIALEGLAIRLAPDTLQALAGEFAPELARLAPAFARVLEWQSAGPTAASHDERKTLTALAEFFTQLSAHVPVVVTLEDLHVADESTIVFLEHMARLVPELQILVLCTFRADAVLTPSPLRLLCAGLEAQQKAKCLSIGPLSRDDLGTLMSRLLGAPVSKDVLRIAADVSGGSPFYAEEVAWGLQGRRRIEQVNGVWQVRKGIRVTWSRDDVRQLSDGRGDFQLARKLRSV